MFFIILILALIFYFLVWPVAKVAWKGYKLHRRWMDATAGMRDAYRQASQQRQNTPKAKKKKIDPSVGEYVTFEEIACNTTIETHTDSSSTKVRVESQIEDVSWEDIK